MRPIVIILALALCGTLVAFLPGAQARNLYCTDLKGTNTCPGLVCVDENLDNSFQWDECVQVYCVTGCCYGEPCPPPPQD